MSQISLLMLLLFSQSLPKALNTITYTSTSQLNCRRVSHIKFLTLWSWRPAHINEDQPCFVLGSFTDWSGPPHQPLSGVTHTCRTKPVGRVCTGFCLVVNTFRAYFGFKLSPDCLQTGGRCFLQSPLQLWGLLHLWQRERRSVPTVEHFPSRMSVS